MLSVITAAEGINTKRVTFTFYNRQFMSVKINVSRTGSGSHQNENKLYFV